MAKEKAVIVTTAHRGVFFGYLKEPAGERKTLRIERARMCVYWSADVRGIVGLAATGPSNGCKIGPAAPAITVQDVTAVIEVSDEAAKKWEEGPWSR